MSTQTRVHAMRLPQSGGPSRALPSAPVQGRSVAGHGGPGAPLPERQLGLSDGVSAAQTLWQSRRSRRAAVSLPTCQPCPGLPRNSLFSSVKGCSPGAPAPPSEAPQSGLPPSLITRSPTSSPKKGISQVIPGQMSRSLGEGHLSSAAAQTACESRRRDAAGAAAAQALRGPLISA